MNTSYPYAYTTMKTPTTSRRKATTTSTMMSSVKPPRHPSTIAIHHQRGTPSISNRRMIGGNTMAPPSSSATADRFIPSRSRMDVSQVRKALFENNNNNNNDVHENLHYKRQLSQALFHHDETNQQNSQQNHHNRLLAFGSPQQTNNRNTIASPFHHDQLRTPSLTNSSVDSPFTSSSSISAAPIAATTSSAAAEKKTTLKPNMTLSAPDLVLDEELTLLQCGPTYLAVALGDKVYIRDNKTGATELLTIIDEEDEVYSCVSWSPDGQYLALGLASCIQIWCPRTKELKHEMSYHADYVTAIAWKSDNTEIAAASTGSGIKRYTLKKKNCNRPQRVALYYCEIDNNDDENNEDRITSLEWNDHHLVSTCTNGNIHIWDATQSGKVEKPLRTMYHEGVQSIQFFPSLSNWMVSGGQDGLKFWNVQNGQLRTVIKTESHITSLTCFRGQQQQNNDMLVVSYGEKLCLYSVCPKLVLLTEEIVDADSTLCVTVRTDNGQQIIYCAHSNETLSGYSIIQPSHQSRSSIKRRMVENSFGRLNMQVIR